MKRKHAASNNPCSVACMSLNLIPSTYKTDWLYARIRAFNAKILNICNVVTNVHRPCFITWQTGKKRQHRKCQHHKGHNKTNIFLMWSSQYNFTNAMMKNTFRILNFHPFSTFVPLRHKWKDTGKMDLTKKQNASREL